MESILRIAGRDEAQSYVRLLYKGHFHKQNTTFRHLSISSRHQAADFGLFLSVAVELLWHIPFPIFVFFRALRFLWFLKFSSQEGKILKTDLGVPQPSVNSTHEPTQPIREVHFLDFSHILKPSHFKQE